MQATSEATLEVMAGLHLPLRSPASEAPLGSLSRFTALRSLHLRQAHDVTLTPGHPALPTGLRHVAYSSCLALATPFSCDSSIRLSIDTR